MPDICYAVVGSSGYLGSSIVELLSQNISNLIFAIDQRPPATYIDAKNIKYITTSDLSSLDWTDSPDQVHVIYTAVISSHLLETSNLDDGVLSDLHALSSFYKSLSPTKNYTFTYLSSSAVYGHCKGLITTNSDLSPVNPYSLMKIQSELIVKYMSSILNIPSIVFRLFQSYSPYQNPVNLIGKLMHTLCTDSTVTLYKSGSPVRSFLYIDDLIKALCLLPSCEGCTIYNLGSPDRCSLKSFSDAIGARYRLTGDIDPSDIVLPDISKFEEDYNWSPSVSLLDGSSLIRKHFKSLI